MELESFKRVGIIGCGDMGPAIAAAITVKYPVIVMNVNDAAGC